MKEISCQKINIIFIMCLCHIKDSNTTQISLFQFCNSTYKCFVTNLQCKIKALNNFLNISSHTNSWSNSITRTCLTINNNNKNIKEKKVKKELLYVFLRIQYSKMALQVSFDRFV